MSAYAKKKSKTNSKTQRMPTKEESEYKYVQFSKRLITYVIIFWSIIRLVSVLVTIINPDAGVSMASIVRGVDDIAMINVFAYTGNSISEKISLSYFKYKTIEANNMAKMALKAHDKEEDDKEEDENSNG